MSSSEDGGCLRENSQPAEWIDAIENGQNACGDRRPADAVKAVASGDEIAVEFAAARHLCESE